MPGTRVHYGSIDNSQVKVAAIEKLIKDDANVSTIRIFNPGETPAPERRAERNTRDDDEDSDSDDDGGFNIRSDGSWSVRCVIL
ncbi:hypothetical protein AGMMS49921_13300 [Endomicrobiia bacterium]|nr:hypothetical protein AGMMS49921_13300 [Endomicrobiia bacterium]